MKTITSKEFVAMWGNPRDPISHVNIEHALEQLSSSLAEDWKIFQHAFDEAAFKHGLWEYAHFRIILNAHMKSIINLSFDETSNPEFWLAWYKQEHWLPYKELYQIAEVI